MPVEEFRQLEKLYEARMSNEPEVSWIPVSIASMTKLLNMCGGQTHMPVDAPSEEAKPVLKTSSSLFLHYKKIYIYILYIYP